MQPVHHTKFIILQLCMSAAAVYAYVGHTAHDGVTLTISLCVIKPVVTRKQCVSYQVNECSAK